MNLRIPAYEYKHPHHPGTSAGCSTVSAPLQLSQASRSRGLRPVAMESAALVLTNRSCLFRFQSGTSTHYGFRNHRDPSARMRDGVDMALVSTSTEAALRKGHDRGGSGDEVGKRLKVSNA